MTFINFPVPVWVPKPKGMRRAEAVCVSCGGYFYGAEFQRGRDTSFPTVCPYCGNQTFAKRASAERRRVRAGRSTSDS